VADCQPLITPEFLAAMTGADVSDAARTEWVIVTVSTLIGEELGGCVDPTTSTMKLRVVCAQYCAYVMQSGSGSGAAGNLRAEQIGDYRVEYQSSNKNDSFDLSVLRELLQSMHGESAYTITTIEQRYESSTPYFDPFDPGFDEVEDGEMLGLFGDGDDLALDEAVGS
jgi:hypothetical protein